MREYNFENVIIACGIGVFGAIVNVANNIGRARKTAQSLSYMDVMVFFVTSLFSGLVFGLMAVGFGELMDIRITIVQLYLSIAIGTIIGWDGLTKLANKSLDAVIYAIKK